MLFGKQTAADLRIVDFATQNSGKRIFYVGAYAFQVHRDIERIMGILIGRGVTFEVRKDLFGQRFTLDNGTEIYFRCDEDSLRGNTADYVQTREVPPDTMKNIIYPMTCVTGGTIDEL